MHRIRIRFAKKDLVAKGVQNGVKLLCLMGLLCIALGEYLGKDTIQYSYSADTRDAMGAPNRTVQLRVFLPGRSDPARGRRLEEFVQQMDRAVKDSLTAERKRRKMADQMGWVYLVDQQKAALRIKQRVFQMGEYISGIPADFWFSYLAIPSCRTRRSWRSTSLTLACGCRRRAAPCAWRPPPQWVITLCIENKVPKAACPTSCAVCWKPRASRCWKPKHWTKYKQKAKAALPEPFREAAFCILFGPGRAGSHLAAA